MINFGIYELQIYYCDSIHDREYHYLNYHDNNNSTIAQR